MIANNNQMAVVRVMTSTESPDDAARLAVALCGGARVTSLGTVQASGADYPVQWWFWSDTGSAGLITVQRAGSPDAPTEQASRSILGMTDQASFWWSVGVHFRAPQELQVANGADKRAIAVAWSKPQPDPSSPGTSSAAKAELERVEGAQSTVRLLSPWSSQLEVLASAPRGLGELALSIPAAMGTIASQAATAIKTGAGLFVGVAVLGILALAGPKLLAAFRRGTR